MRFKAKRTQGVVIRINSPGGSPVQAGHINDEIRRLREKYPNIPGMRWWRYLCVGRILLAVAADKYLYQPNRASWDR